MVKVAWKVIKGNGPYAYLQKSVKKPNGSVTSQHLAYLGGIGKKGMFPGKFFTVPPTDDGEFHGGRVLINPVPDELKVQLKPAALEALESIEAQVQSGVSTKDIVVPQKDKLGATPKPTPASPAPPASPGELGATDLPAEAPAKTQPKKGKLGATPKPPLASPASPPAGPGKSGATQTTQSVPDASPAPASLPALPSLAALLPGYVSPSKKVEHYERLEQATAASMAESGLPHGIRAAQLHAKALQEQLSPAQRSAVNRARTRLTSLMLSAWIGSAGDPKGVAPDVATQSSRRLASAAARGGIATLEQEAARLKAQNADPARAEYIGSIVSLVKTHLPTELDAGVTAKPAPAPVSAEPTMTPVGPVSSKPAKSGPPPKLSDLVPGYSTPKVSHQSHGELELVAAEAIKSTEDIRDGIRAARRYAEILKQELPAHEHSGVDTAVNWLTADILHAAAKYTFGAPGWFPDGMGASDLYDLAQAAGHGGLSGLVQKAQELSTSASKATGVQAAVNNIKNFMPLDSRDPDATPPTPPSPGRRSVEVPAPAPAVAGDLPLSPPKISAVPKDAKGKALIHPANVKKLEQVAAHGDVATLEELGQQLAGKMLAPAKKTAIADAVADLKSQLGVVPSSGAAPSRANGAPLSQPDPLETAPSPPTAPPEMSALAKALQSVAAQKAAHEDSAGADSPPESPVVPQGPVEKDWDADLVMVSGAKGSNQGGLFKDQGTDALHYVKWSGSPVRSRVETLAGMLYAEAGVPVPQLRTIDFKGQTAVMSDWIDAQPMNISQMKGHPDVRENFVVDAWLANWDVVGLDADNIVLGPDGKAYRIDVGGSLLFRAQGKPKPFPPFVEEHKTLLSTHTNPNSAQVFQGLSDQELLAGAAKIASVSDAKIDALVDQMDLPKTSDDYKDTDDLPTALKWRLKKRRDHLVSEIEKQVGQSTPAPVQETGTSAGVSPLSSRTAPSQSGFEAPGVVPLTPEGQEAYAELAQITKSGPHQNDPSAAIKAVQTHASIMKGSWFAHNPDAVSAAEKWMLSGILFEAVKASFNGAGQYGDQSGYPEGLETDDLRALVTAAGHQGVIRLQHKAGALATNPVKGAAVQQAVDTIKGILPDGTPPTAPESPAPDPDPAPAKPATGPKISDIPSNHAGNPLIAASNVAKLEKAAATGSVDALDQAAAEIKSKKIGYLKKAAINKAVQDLKEQMAEQHGREPVSDTGMSAAVEAVSDGDVKMPSRPVPAPEVVQRHVDLQEKGKKDWEADLVQVDGKKGSTQGALFKDQHLNTVHYVKWSDSDLRPRVEALTGALYTLADVPVPIQRIIDFKGQTAVMSDWLDDASPMTVAQLTQHPDVRRNFVVDAWLANWDVVGANGVNIVKGPGDKAYRVDLGGSLLFRAMGGGKSLSPEVGELTSMLDSGQNAVAAQVFADVTDAQLQAGAERVGKISDQQIDDAVDQLEIPKTSPDYPVSAFGETAGDIPTLLKSRLKQRRDYVAKEVLNIIDLKQKKAQEAEKQLAQLEETSDLKPETLATVLEHAPKLKLNMAKQHRRDIQDQVLAAELGKTKGKKASGSVSSTFNGWKGSANSPSGRLMRWATGAIDGSGDRELRRLQKFNEFLVSKKMLPHHTSAKEIDEVNDAAASSRGENLAEGLQVTRKANRIARVLQNPGETHVTVYRGWRPEQVEYLKLQTSEVGDKIVLEDPPVYSWSFDLQTAKSFGSGSLVTKAEVPIDKLILTDRLNNTGNHSGENEVLFKGVENQKMEVLYKY